MKNQKHLDRLISAGYKVKNVDKAGNVRFVNNHSVGYPSMRTEPKFFWVSSKHLRLLADEEECGNDAA